MGRLERVGSGLYLGARGPSLASLDAGLCALRWSAAASGRPGPVPRPRGGDVRRELGHRVRR